MNAHVPTDYDPDKQARANTALSDLLDCMSETDDEAGVEVVGFVDRNPIEVQAASWNRLREMIQGWHEQAKAKS